MSGSHVGLPPCAQAFINPAPAPTEAPQGTELLRHEAVVVLLRRDGDVALHCVPDWYPLFLTTLSEIVTDYHGAVHSVNGTQITASWDVVVQGSDAPGRALGCTLALLDHLRRPGPEAPSCSPEGAWHAAVVGGDVTYAHLWALRKLELMGALVAFAERLLRLGSTLQVWPTPPHTPPHPTPPHPTPPHH